MHEHFPHDNLVYRSCQVSPRYMKDILCGSTVNLTSIHDKKYLFTRTTDSYELGMLAIEVNL